MDDDELLDRAQFGRQIELFWSSRVGEHLRAHVSACYTAAIQKLKSVDPLDPKAVMAAQNEVWRAESFEDWLSSAVLDGMKALEILEGDDENVG